MRSRVISFAVRCALFPLRKLRGVVSRIKFEGRLSQTLRKSRGQKRILFAGTPLHGNLGDHAIAIAMREFFEKRFPGREAVEIPGARILQMGKRARQFFSGKVENSDVVAIIGGGFLGTLWMNEEEMVRTVVAAFPQNKIIIFPQTVFFDKTEIGRAELEATRRIWRGHKNLHAFIRDKSIDFAKREITAKNIFSAPDIVLALNRSESEFERKGVLLCFRADKEKVFSGEGIANLEKKLEAQGERVLRTDTVVPYGVPAEVREAEVERKFDEFRKARLVITDRLHGMIFAAITGTPCIALNNSSGKVEGVWSLWLRHLPYVKFVQSTGLEPALIDEMLALGGQSYNPAVFEKYWQEIADTIKGD